MTDIEQIAPADLLEAARSYRYDERRYFPLERQIWKRIGSFNGAFGHSMLEHLNRTSHQFLALLDHRQYEPAAAFNLASAFRLHDAGKILQPENLWGLEDKPSDAVKRERSEHSRLGLVVLADAAAQFPELRRDPHIAVIGCLMLHHHDRINGTGPNNIRGDQLGEPLELAGIIDTLDGKMIARGGQQTSLAQALRDMTGDPRLTSKDKHRGEFRPGLLHDTIEFYQLRTAEPILHSVRPSQQPSLAI